MREYKFLRVNTRNPQDASEMLQREALQNWRVIHVLESSTDRPLILLERESDELPDAEFIEKLKDMGKKDA